MRSVIEAISDPKRTGLGTGRFVTTRLDYVAVPDADVPVVDASDDEVHDALRRRRAGGHHALPHPQVPAAGRTTREPRHARRPPASGHHPGQRLLVRGRPRRTSCSFSTARRAARCATRRCRPARVCGSLEWDTVESSGRGTLYSYVVVHYPQVPAFEYPLPIGLIELEEGTRVVANLEGVDADAIADRHGAAGRVRRLRRGAARCPVFVPAGAAAGAGKDA